MRSQRYLIYNLLFFGTVLTFVAGVAWTASSWQGYDGDLTRIGGQPEEDFGWNLEQEVFTERHFTIGRSAADYRTYHDVVVLGDSYTIRPGPTNRWVDYFADLSGRSVFVVRIHDGDAEILEFLSSPGFREHPPRVLILQTAERVAVHRLAGIGPLPEPAPAREPMPALALVPLRSERTWVRRRVSASALERISQVTRLLQARLGIHLEADLAVAIETPPLPGLFSSRNQTEILVYAQDYEKRRLTRTDVERAADRLRALTAAVEGNGRTTFLPLVVPDKSTVYGHYAMDEHQRTPNMLAALAELTPIIRLDQRFRDALRRGAADLYLPNDTHTGYLGNRMIAEAAIEALSERGAFRDPAP